MYLNYCISPLLINEVLVNAIRVAMAPLPAVLVKLCLFVMVVPDTTNVTIPAPV